MDSSVLILTMAQVAGALALLYVGGESLIRGASALGARLGISPLAMGLTVVAFGTSAPELAVSVEAALSGANDISVGNVVGSNIANIALILGLATLVRPAAVEAKIVRLDAPMMILVSLALVAVLISGTISRFEGCLLVVGLVVYVTFTYRGARRESIRVRAEFSEAAPKAPTSTIVGAVFVTSGLGLLTAGGHLLVTAAVDLALTLGLSEAAVGLTIVAVGTSLPELATSVIASLRGQGDIAVGNVVGSNIFNILGILGLTAVIRPLELGGLSWNDLGVMVGLACVFMILLYRHLRLGRIEGSCLLAGYVVYVAWLFTEHSAAG